MIRHWLAPISILKLQSSLIRQQTITLDEQRMETHRLRLEHAKEIQGILSAWLISLERPEVDLRHDLARAEKELAEKISVLEEHLV